MHLPPPPLHSVPPSLLSQRYTDGYCHIHRSHATMALVEIRQIVGGDTLELTEVGRAGAAALAPFLQATTTLQHLKTEGLTADGMGVLREAVAQNTCVCIIHTLHT
jgi:hypothetical protein